MDIAIKLLLVALVVIWLALVVWTFTDARRRIADRFLVGCATVASLFPFIGSLVYLIVRPPELLADVHERDLEVAAAEARLQSVRGSTCPHCDAATEKDFLRCPSCLRKLREPCPSCSKPLDPEWRICPYCEADPLKGAASQSTAPARRRRASGSGRTGETDQVTSGATSAAGDGAKATTKAAAKRNTRRKASPASTDSTEASPAPTKPRRARAVEADSSTEPEPTA